MTPNMKVSMDRVGYQFGKGGTIWGEVGEGLNSVQLRFFHVFNPFHLLVEQLVRQKPASPGDQKHNTNTDSSP